MLNRIIICNGMNKKLEVEAGLGYGSMLLDFAKANGATRVDVNQQNPSALLFYISKGFHIIGLDDTDEAGRPYPILHLSL